MANTLFEYAVKFIADDKDVDEKTEGVKGKLDGLSSFLGGVGKVGAAAFAAVGTATVALGKQAVDAYANYEQLSGGIEKLFGQEGAGIVAEYAEKAFLTSGKSINEYYNSVSQITASLKRSIGDDMGEVARVADVAMQVISDNVNTFGSDAGSVENAIMGLSRQNYTMLDNLKLGYAGTAQGMMELINDSGILGKTLTDTSQLANVGFDQMVIDNKKVQEEQGIAGTTAKEALHTIEGSQKAVAAGWQNVVTAIGRGEGLSEALSGVTTALFGDGTENSGFVAQIIPRIKTTMESIGEFVVQTAPLIADKLPELANSILPVVFKTITTLTATLGKFLFKELPTLIPNLLKTVGDMIKSVADFIISNIPSIIQAGLDLISGLAKGMGNNLPKVLATITDMMIRLLAAIVSKIPNIVSTGIQLIGGLIRGIVASIPSVLGAIGNLIGNAARSFLNFDWLSIGRNIINGVVNGIRNFGGAIRNALTDIAGSAWRGVKSFFGISSPSKLMRDTIGKFIPLGIAEGIEDTADSVFDAMEDLGDGTVNSYDTVFDDFDKKVVGQPDRNVNYGGLVFNIYGAEGQSAEEIALAVRDIIVSEEERSKLVYA